MKLDQSDWNLSVVCHWCQIRPNNGENRYYMGFFFCWVMNSRQEAAARRTLWYVIRLEGWHMPPQVQGSGQVNRIGGRINVFHKDGDRDREAALIFSCKTQQDQVRWGGTEQTCSGFGCQVHAGASSSGLWRNSGKCDWRFTNTKEVFGVRLLHSFGLLPGVWSEEGIH